VSESVLPPGEVVCHTPPEESLDVQLSAALVPEVVEYLKGNILMFLVFLYEYFFKIAVIAILKHQNVAVKVKCFDVFSVFM